MNRLSRFAFFVFALALAFSPSFEAWGQLRLIIDTLDISQFPAIRAKLKIEQNGFPVGNLTIANFIIREDGVNQAPIQGACVDSIIDENVSVALVLDRSGSIVNDWSRVQSSAKSFITRLAADDSACVLSFGGGGMNGTTYTKVEIRWTNNKTALTQSIDNIDSPDGGTPLWEAVVKAANEFTGRIGKKIMIVLTDGENTAMNGYTFDQAVNAALSIGAKAYTIALGDRLDEYSLQQLAQQTGGKYYSAPTSSALDAIYQEISKELMPTGICEVGYTSGMDCLDGSEHTVEIIANTQFGQTSASARFTLPLDSSTLSFIDVAVNDDFVVEAGEKITVPLRITNITENRPPTYFSFDIDFDRTLLTLVEALPTPLSANYHIQFTDTPGGVTLVMQGADSIKQEGDLVYLIFKAERILNSAKSPIGVSEPNVQKACTYPSSSDGLITVSGICERALAPGTTTGFKTALLPNVPNPFNPVTSVHYSIGMETPVLITLHDPLGKEVQTLVNQKMYPGQFSVTLDGSNLQNGVYFLKLVTLSTTDTRRIVLLK